VGFVEKTLGYFLQTLYHKISYVIRQTKIVISVVIPVYNEKENLMRLLPWLGILSQKHNVEIIVSVGECSQDYSTCLEGLNRVKLVSGKRKGRAKQMNDGALHANGEILVFLHADVFPPKGFFTDIEATLASGHDAGFFSYQFDKDDFFLKVNAAYTKKDGWFTGGGDQCLFIKKSIFQQLGRFDENQVLMEDFEFFSRMKRANISYKIVPNDLIVSARKYDHNSYLRVNLSNLLLVILFRCKVPSKTLRRLHYRLLRVPR